MCDVNWIIYLYFSAELEPVNKLNGRKFKLNFLKKIVQPTEDSFAFIFFIDSRLLRLLKRERKVLVGKISTTFNDSRVDFEYVFCDWFWLFSSDNYVIWILQLLFFVQFFLESTKFDKKIKIVFLKSKFSLLCIDS